MLWDVKVVCGRKEWEEDKKKRSDCRIDFAAKLTNLQSRYSTGGGLAPVIGRFIPLNGNLPFFWSGMKDGLRSKSDLIRYSTAREEERR